jgi:hypothetical protein
MREMVEHNRNRSGNGDDFKASLKILLGPLLHSCDEFHLRAASMDDATMKMVEILNIENGQQKLESLLGSGPINGTVIQSLY